MISKTSKLLEIYGLDSLEPLHFPKNSYPDNPEVVFRYSFFSNLWKELAFSRAWMRNKRLTTKTDGCHLPWYR
jgi:hypothetical protein